MNTNKIGQFTIEYATENDLFVVNEKKYILRNGVVYGVIYKDGTIQKRNFYNYLKNTGLEISIHNKLYWKINYIRRYTNDKRFIDLYDNYLHSNDYYNCLQMYFSPTYRLK